MILSIQTASMDSMLQLQKADGTVVATESWESGRALSEDILRRIAELVAGNKLELGDLTGIIIFSGPGSFTSLRIGHSVANALADGLGIPIVGTMGEDWIQEGIIELKTSGAKEPALPFYGSEPNTHQTQIVKVLHQVFQSH